LIIILFQNFQAKRSIMTTTILYPDDVAPELTVPLLNGGTFTLSDSNPKNFTIVIFYRGAFCPLCMNYIGEIDKHYKTAAAAGFDIVLVSMDTKEKAEASTQGITTKVPIGYGMTEEVARSWGLYISSGRPNTAEPAVFSEPGLFVIRPQGDNTIFMAMVQSAPFTRPSMEQLIGGLQYAVDNKYPTRGNITKLQ
jgi:peroxiredoxin